MVVVKSKHLGTFRLVDYLTPKVHAAYIRDIRIINMVYLTALATLYLDHADSVGTNLRLYLFPPY